VYSKGGRVPGSLPILIENGKRIGVAAQSHKAIHNL
jgi:hypothetical protein